MQIDAPTSAGGPYFLDYPHRTRVDPPRPYMQVNVIRRGQSPLPAAAEGQDDLCVWEVGAESPWLDLSDPYIERCTWHDSDPE
jgi:hypothetical protein